MEELLQHPHYTAALLRGYTPMLLYGRPVNESLDQTASALAVFEPDKRGLRPRSKTRCQ
jgi:hypothetical protein